MCTKVQGQSDTLRLDFSVYSGEPLAKVFQTLTEDHGVVFSFDPSAVAVVVAPVVGDDEMNISAYLNIALRGTDLTFQVISDTYVLVERPGPTSGTEKISLVGVVRDVSSGESLPYASVSVKGTSLRTTANSEGGFSLLNIPGDTCLVEVSYLGYSPALVRVSSVRGTVPAIFSLQKRSRLLPPVEVQAIQEEMLEHHNQPGQITFNASEIAVLPNLGESDVFSALRRLPGLGNNGWIGSGIRIRGGNSDENLVMFDGIPIYHLDHFFGYSSAFHTPMIKHVQVYKGSFDAKYGGRTSGVIDIVGIDGNKENPEFMAEANTLSASALGQIPIVKNKISLVASFRRSYTDQWANPVFQRMLNHLNNGHVPTPGSKPVDVFAGSHPPEFGYRDFHAKLSMKPSELDAVSLSFYNGKDFLDMRFNHEQDGVRRTSTDHTEWGNLGGSAKWARKWGKRFSSSAQFGISRYESDLRAFETFYTNGDLFSSNVFEQLVALDDRSIRLDHTFEISDGYKLEFGWWHTENNILTQAQNAVEILRDSSITGRLNAGYLSFFQRGKRVQTVWGLRLSHYDRTDKRYLAPRWSGSLQIVPSLQLKASAGIHYQMIRRLNERSLYLSIPESWALADPESVPVGRSDHYQVEVHLDRNGWDFILAGFHKYERGVVEIPFPEFGTPSGVLEQLAIDGRRSIFGAELLIEKSMKRHRVLVAYTLMDARSKYRDLNGGAYFPSPGLADHVLSAIYGYRVGRWEFTAAQTLSYGSKYTPVFGSTIDTSATGETSQVIVAGAPSSSTLPANHRLDVAAHYTLPLKKGMMEFGLTIYNVYNSRSIIGMQYFAVPQPDSDFYGLGRRELPELGITPSLFAKIRFH